MHSRLLRYPTLCVFCASVWLWPASAARGEAGRAGGPAAGFPPAPAQGGAFAHDGGMPAGAPQAPRGLLGEYFDNDNFQGLPRVTRIDRRVAFNCGDGSPLPGMPRDHFSIRWTGLLMPRYSESYLFCGNRDDGIRVWLDDRLVIDAWNESDWAFFQSRSLPLVAGRLYRLRVEYLEIRGGARVDLRWKSRRQQEETIPAECLLPPPGRPVHGPGPSLPPEPPRPPGPPRPPERVAGLLGEYFPNSRLEGSPLVTRIDARLTFVWGDGAPANGLPSDQFSARWTGWLRPHKAGLYQLCGNRDDGIRVWLGDRLVIDQWNESDYGYFESAPMELRAGEEYRLRVEYLELRGGARLDLRWKRTGQGEESLPPSCLLTTIPPSPPPARHR